eukprot:jgi/Botrbrau1/337/Bobra.0022s0291.1
MASGPFRLKSQSQVCHVQLMSGSNINYQQCGIKLLSPNSNPTSSPNENLPL